MPNVLLVYVHLMSLMQGLLASYDLLYIGEIFHRDGQGGRSHN